MSEIMAVREVMLRLIGLLILCVVSALTGPVQAGATHTAASQHHRPVTFSEDGRFFSFRVLPDQLAGVVDVSTLNRALTPADRVFVANGHFHRVGADLRAHTDDDERVRFFGVNLSYGANFPPPEQAPVIARNLRKLGFNAVRLHHLDTAPDDSTTQPRSVLTRGPYPSFNEEAVRRLRHFIQALAKEGLYINLNLRVGYRFRPGIDAVPEFDAGAMKRPIGSPIIVFHPDMVQLQQRYARELISQLGLKEHPVLAMVEINNESSLLAAWQRREWNDAVPDNYRPILRERWHAWLIRRYGSLERACAQWGTCDGRKVVPELLSLIDADLPGEMQAGWKEWARTRWNELSSRMPFGAPPDTVPATGRHRRTADFLLFLAETDAAYFRLMRETIHQATDTFVPVTGTQMGYGGGLNFTSHAALDYIDNHFYIDHPTFARGSGQPRDWRIWNESLTGKRMDVLLSESFLKEASKPFVISEFNQPYPSRFGAEILPLTAAVANLQDWDALFFYEYSVATGSPAAPANFALLGDWGKYVLTAQTARLFRTGAVPPLRDELVIPFPRDAQLAVALKHDRHAYRQYLMRAYGVVPEHAWHYRLAVSLDPNATWASAPPVPAVPYESPNRALLYNPSQQLAYLNTNTDAGVFGQVTGGQSRGSRLRVRALMPGTHAVAVLLSTLDARNVEKSRHILLTLGGPTFSSQPGSRPERPKQLVPYPGDPDSWTLEPDPTHLNLPSGSRYAQGSAWLQRQELAVGWDAAPGRVTVYPLDGRGQRLAPLPPERILRQQKRLELHLQATAEETSPWYEILIEDEPAS